MTTYAMYRNANVSLRPVYDEQGNTLASIEIDNVVEHTFPASSRISKSLSFGTSTESLKLATQQLQDRLTGGDYFVVNDQLIDFRDSLYPGFVHEDASIERLFSVIGVSEQNLGWRAGMRQNTTHGAEVMLTNRHSSVPMELKNLGMGGQFDLSILFSWSPFTSFVRGAIELTRLVCANGMVSTTDLINSRVPLINRWEEHLGIANVHLQNQAQALFSSRLEEMTRERATVSTLKLISKHASLRASESTIPAEVLRLQKIDQVTNPAVHLRDYYTDDVFENTNIAAQVPGHLTLFDAWNCITEMSSHTNANNNSTTGSLHMLANKLIFPNTDERNSTKFFNTTPLLSAFSDPDVAFFGV